MSMFPEGETLALCQECVPEFIAGVVDALELMPALVARGEPVSKGVKPGRSRKRPSDGTTSAAESSNDAEPRAPAETDD